LYFLALAADYDGTLAHDGVVASATVDALRRFKATGRRLILVTGRELAPLKDAFPDLDMFDRVVAENGALIHDPATQKQRIIAEPPTAAFVERLRDRGVAPLSVGRSIVATWEPHGTTVLQVIRDLGLELQIIFNKGAVMILPPGVNKATGLAAALRELELSHHNVVGVGDAENDHAFLHACGCAAAVANALPMVKESADVKLAADHGAGVVELMELIARDEARILPPARHGILIGRDGDRNVYIEPYRGSVLVTGQSGAGKSTLATALTERMAERKFEFCVFDPEGDYHDLEDAVSIGDADTPPTAQEAIKLLRKAGSNVVINTQSLKVDERPAFFAKLLPQVAALRAATGRPHWLLIDEAHHLLPASRDDMTEILPDELPATILVTVHPEAVSPIALKKVETVIAVGEGAHEALAAFDRSRGTSIPDLDVAPSGDEALVWTVGSGEAARRIKPESPEQVHKRHVRKYAKGDLGKDLSFYFRGPDNKLNLRAQNLALFLQMAKGVDERTWMHHLRRGDYSAWFRSAIKDDELAAETAQIESDQSLDAEEARRRVENAVTSRYTAPALEHEKM
jgi:HAD superfamily hydrolase (TIGR01484 family)